MEGYDYNSSNRIKDAITIVLDELNRAAGEIVTLREQVNQHMTSLNEAAVFSTSLIQDLQRKGLAAELESARLARLIAVAANPLARA